MNVYGLIVKTTALFAFFLNFGNACYRIRERKCCEHYMLENNTCKPCPPGYTGASCSTPCPSPSYGLRCQYLCHTCSMASCHHVIGCLVYTSSSIIPKAETLSRFRTTFISEEDSTSVLEEDVTISRTQILQRKILIAVLTLTLIIIVGFLSSLIYYKAKLCRRLGKMDILTNASLHS
ncbi:uncharacterized protein LOC144619776 [Crassostrea virginica]